MQSVKQKEWYLKNKILTIERAKNWKKNNPDKVKKIAKRYYNENKEVLYLKKQEWRKKNPEKTYAQSKRYILKNKNKVRFWKREWTRKNSERLKKYKYDRYRKDINLSRKKHNDWLKNRYPMEKKLIRKTRQEIRRYRIMYGLTIDEIEKIKVKQNYLCLICKKERKLCVDHCHNTGKVRGLLCGSCNRALGLMNDDKNIIKKAYEYLAEFTKKI